MDRFIRSVWEVIEGQPCTQSYEFVNEAKALQASLRKSTGNVTYIVGGVLIEDDKLLMIQEAKKSCRGLWYLPIGRLETGETLEAGAQREVLEESGIKFTPKSLVCVEWYDGHWIRFIFTGQDVEGKLKTPEQQDHESIQADYFTDEQVRSHLKLRCKDALDVISRTQSWYKNLVANTQAILLPVCRPHKTVAVRILLAGCIKDTKEVYILAELGPNMHLPISVLDKHARKTGPAAVENAVKSAGYHGTFDIKGVLSVEHSGETNGHDGIWLTLFATTTKFTKDSKNWINIDSDQGLKQKILKLMHETKLVPIYTD
ncbi:8-oxo-dGDP phosphatase NUDT18 [Trichoplax sp. H2]|nr:8-oxo-dGDP phosphatase NUDT18 [Trichoplax sp. H2]|eukprot:RDD39921.1 8-oxo-dGDP phosphatase NUDT18 [Trichoplax sp. H2]